MRETDFGNAVPVEGAGAGVIGMGLGMKVDVGGK